MTKSTPVVAAAQNAFASLTSDEVNDFAKMPTKQASNSQVNIIQPIPDDAPELSLKHYKNGEPTQYWAYTDAHGNVLFYVCRKDMPNGKKVIWPISLVKNKQGKIVWQSRWPTDSRPLLNQADVLAKETVLIVEGETSVDAGKLLFPELAVTTCSGGCNGSKKTDFSSVSEKFVILMPDNDKAGTNGMRNVAKKVYDAGAKKVFILHPTAFSKDIKEGWDLADALKEGFTPEQCQFILENNTQHYPNPYLTEEFTGNEFPYDSDSEGVWFKQTNKDGEGYVTKVCSPLTVNALVRDHANGNWGYVLDVTDRDHKVHQVIIPAHAFVGHGKEALELLLSKGLVIQDIQKADKHVMSYIQTFPTDARGRTADRIGWSGDKFVATHKVYGSEDNEQVFFEGNQRNKAEFKMAGTKEDWDENVAKYAIGNSRFIMAICAALASPLLPLIKAENTGFHFLGSSSIGKSTLLNVACSIYGLTKHVWRATDNALETLLASHNNVLLCMDELGQLDKKAAQHIAYLIGNGMGKSRMSQNAMAKKVYEWLLIILSSGEKSLQDLMNEEGKGRKQTAGEIVRFLDILADAGYGLGTFKTTHGFASGKELSEHLNKASATYHGTAGDAWLEHLTTNMDEVTDAAYDIIKQFEDSLDIDDADGQVKRVAVRFANVAAAGEIAIEAGILPWPKGEAIEGVKACFQSWLHERGSKQSSEILNATDNLKTNLEKYASRNFEYWDTDYGRNATTASKHEAWGWKRKNNQDDWEFFVTENGFKSLTGGFHSKALKESFVNNGLMTLAENGEFKKQYRVPSHGRQRLYHLTPHNLMD